MAVQTSASILDTDVRVENFLKHILRMNGKP